MTHPVDPWASTDHDPSSNTESITNSGEIHTTTQTLAFARADIHTAVYARRPADGKGEGLRTFGRRQVALRAARRAGLPEEKWGARPTPECGGVDRARLQDVDHRRSLGKNVLSRRT